MSHQSAWPRPIGSYERIWWCSGAMGCATTPSQQYCVAPKRCRSISSVLMSRVSMGWSDKLLLRKRAIIETITDQLKNICQIEHSRHRSPINFLVNLVAGLIAYCHQPKKPSLGVQLPTLPEA